MLGTRLDPEINWRNNHAGFGRDLACWLGHARLGFRDYLRPEGGDKSVIPLPPFPCMKLGLGLGLGLGFGVLNPNEPVTAN